MKAAKIRRPPGKHSCVRAGHKHDHLPDTRIVGKCGTDSGVRVGKKDKTSDQDS